jgi:3-hydroxyisobutyrate dehydrogenase-like beta-hydroxyacid dehydrogenase
MDELEQLLAEMAEQEARDARKASEAKLMWHVISAIHNAVVDEGGCVIRAGGATADVIAEIVNRVEERA